MKSCSLCASEMTPSSTLEDQGKKTTYLCPLCGAVEYEFTGYADWYEAYCDDVYRKYIPDCKRKSEKHQDWKRPSRQAWRDYLEV